MNGDPHTASEANETVIDGAIGARQAARPAAAPGQAGTVSEDTRIAIDIRELVQRGELDVARDRFAELVTIHQRRASRIAYQYLRDASEADEAVQDAFVKVFSHIGSYREAWPFEVWFTRILINGCLDRRKSRARRDRWFVPADEGGGLEESLPTFGGAPDLDPEARLLARERRARLAAAVDRLDGRQRSVFMLCHYGDYTA